MTFDVDAVLAALTLEEKASLTSGSAFWWTAPVERLGVPRILMADGPHGLRVQPGDTDQLGIGGSLPATCFPTASAVASSWDPALLHRIGRALAQEARASRLSLVLGPGINMKRSPLCGRNFEYLSEDPFLAGALAVAIVDGIQSRGVGAAVKHFAANNQETERLRVDAQVDERTLREIYLPAFEHVVTTSQPWAVMAAYNKVNGLSATENPGLLQTVLRDELGFTGLVVSDWGAVYHRVPALLAGTDLEMPPVLERSPGEVVAAVEAGTVAADVLDARVRTVLELVAKGAAVLDLDESFPVDEHHALAREAAAASVVLLQNDGLLPLRPGVRLAVVGELARTPRFQGAGSSQVVPTRLDVLVDELRAVYGEVEFAAGYGVTSGPADEALHAEAAQVAGSADVVVVVVGLPVAEESEGFDREHLDLPANQLVALDAVAAVNPNVVVVVVNGGAVVLGDVLPRARAVVEAWLGGQAAAGGIADVLSGAVNPSGRLAETIPHRLEDCSAFLNFPGEAQVVRYGEGVFVGYRGYDKERREVAFPFGFGLSYTTFAYADLDVRTRGSVVEGTLAATVSVTVTNTGDVDGAEVVQVYVTDVAASVNRPPRELKGFAKVWLAAGASETVTVELDQRAFSFWSVLHRRWVVEAGAFVVGVGHHSRDVPLTVTLDVGAPRLTTSLDRESTLADWIGDPLGRRLIEAEVSDGEPAEWDELLSAIGDLPLSALASFGADLLTPDTVDRLAAAWAEQSSNH